MRAHWFTGLLLATTACPLSDVIVGTPCSSDIGCLPAQCTAGAACDTLYCDVDIRPTPYCLARPARPLRQRYRPVASVPVIVTVIENATGAGFGDGVIAIDDQDGRNVGPAKTCSGNPAAGDSVQVRADGTLQVGHLNPESVQLCMADAVQAFVPLETDADGDGALDAPDPATTPTSTTADLHVSTVMWRSNRNEPRVDVPGTARVVATAADLVNVTAADLLIAGAAADWRGGAETQSYGLLVDGRSDPGPVSLVAERFAYVGANGPRPMSERVRVKLGLPALTVPAGACPATGQAPICTLDPGAAAVGGRVATLQVTTAAETYGGVDADVVELSAPLRVTRGTLRANTLRVHMPALTLGAHSAVVDVYDAFSLTEAGRMNICAGRVRIFTDEVTFDGVVASDPAAHWEFHGGTAVAPTVLAARCQEATVLPTVIVAADAHVEVTRSLTVAGDLIVEGVLQVAAGATLRVDGVVVVRPTGALRGAGTLTASCCRLHPVAEWTGFEACTACGADDAPGDGAFTGTADGASCEGPGPQNAVFRVLDPCQD